VSSGTLNHTIPIPTPINVLSIHLSRVHKHVTHARWPAGNLIPVGRQKSVFLIQCTVIALVAAAATDTAISLACQATPASTLLLLLSSLSSACCRHVRCSNMSVLTLSSLTGSGILDNKVHRGQQQSAAESHNAFQRTSFLPQAPIT